MKLKGVGVYLVSLFLLYKRAGIDVALTLTSVSLSVMYVWTAILWLIRGKEKSQLRASNSFLVVNLVIIFAGALIAGVTLAALLLIILLVLSGFILLAQYGLRKELPAKNAEVRLRWFGVLLLGFFSLNPLIEGISARNWIEAIAAIMLVFAGYMMFEDLRKD